MAHRMNSRMMEQTRLVVRSIFSFILLYLLSFIIGGGILFVSIWLIYSSELRIKYDFPNISIIVLLFASAFLLSRMIRSLFHSYKVETKGMRELSRKEMPELFEMIDDVAAFMKTTAPQKVYLSSSVTASVFLSTSSTLFFSPRKKRLEIGVGLMNILTMEELRAVVAHEMGHFSQRSMFLSGYVYSIEQAVYFISRQADFKKNGLWEQQVKGLFDIFHAFAHLLFRKLNRRFRDFSLELEYDADRLAVECVGVPILRSALLKTSFASTIYEDTITILGNWAIHGKCVADIYTAHQYTMDAYLAAFNGRKPFLQNIWVEPIPKTLTPVISSRLKRLLGDDSKDDKMGRLSREYIPTLRLFSTFFTKYIYSDVYKTDVGRLDECHLFVYRKWIHDYYLWLTDQKHKIKENKLHINLPAKLHRLPLVDARLDVFIDKKQIGEGSFKKGIALSVSITPGKHSISITCWAEYYMNEEIIIDDNSQKRLNLDYKAELSKGRYLFFVSGDR